MKNFILITICLMAAAVKASDLYFPEHLYFTKPGGPTYLNYVPRLDHRQFEAAGGFEVSRPLFLDEYKQIEQACFVEKENSIAALIVKKIGGEGKVNSSADVKNMSHAMATAKLQNLGITQTRFDSGENIFFQDIERGQTLLQSVWDEVESYMDPAHEFMTDPTFGDVTSYIREHGRLLNVDNRTVLVTEVPGNSFDLPRVVYVTKDNLGHLMELLSEFALPDISLVFEKSLAEEDWYDGMPHKDVRRMKYVWNSTDGDAVMDFLKMNSDGSVAPSSISYHKGGMRECFLRRMVDCLRQARPN